MSAALALYLSLCSDAIRYVFTAPERVSKGNATTSTSTTSCVNHIADNSSNCISESENNNKNLMRSKKPSAAASPTTTTTTGKMEQVQFRLNYDHLECDYEMAMESKNALTSTSIQSVIRRNYAYTQRPKGVKGRRSYYQL